MKRLPALLFAALLALGCLSVGAYADAGVAMIHSTNIYDGEFEYLSGVTVSGGSIEGLLPDQTIHIRLDYDGNELDTGLGKVLGNTLADDRYFKLKVKKDGDGKALVKSVSQVSDKQDAAGTGRYGWLEIVLGPSESVEELKAELDLTFTAKKTLAASEIQDLVSAPAPGSGWEQGDYARLHLTLYIQNKQARDDDAEPGDQIVYKPVSNEKNELEWDNVATLAFSADDDADKFYAKLSTRAVEEIYSRYPDAELYFRDFTGSPAISATSRAALTLINPWRDSNAPVDPQDCHIYTWDADRELTDVTSLFIYLVTDEQGNDVDGWRTRTRTLGSYLISDRALDTGAGGQAVYFSPQKIDLAGKADAPPEEPDDPVLHTTKANPPTGRF